MREEPQRGPNCRDERRAVLEEPWQWDRFEVLLLVLVRD